MGEVQVRRAEAKQPGATTIEQGVHAMRSAEVQMG
jgi:hypothetical protein